MKPMPSTCITWAMTVIITAITLLAAWMLSGCAPVSPPAPESNAWRTAPPPNFRPPVMERCWRGADGETQCECISPMRGMQAVMCFDEV